MTTTANAVHLVGTRICVGSDCEMAGVLVEFHTRPAKDHTLTDVVLRWRCPACHAWQESYTHGGDSTIIEIEQAR